MKMEQNKTKSALSTLSQAGVGVLQPVRAPTELRSGREHASDDTRHRGRGQRPAGRTADPGETGSIAAAS